MTIENTMTDNGCDRHHNERGLLQSFGLCRWPPTDTSLGSDYLPSPPAECPRYWRAQPMKLQLAPRGGRGGDAQSSAETPPGWIGPHISVTKAGKCAVMNAKLIAAAEESQDRNQRIGWIAERLAQYLAHAFFQLSSY